MPISRRIARTSPTWAAALGLVLTGCSSSAGTGTIATTKPAQPGTDAPPTKGGSSGAGPSAPGITPDTSSSGTGSSIGTGSSSGTGSSHDTGSSSDAGTSNGAASGARPPGAACTCDADCSGTAANAPICVYGVCMTRPSAPCSAAGSRAECGAGARCWSAGTANGDLCWPDCAASSCAGTCDADGSCVATNQGTCDPSCGGICPAANGNTGAGTGADAGTDAAGGPDAAGAIGAGATTCPDWHCTQGCTDIVAMPGSTDPNSAAARAAGYYLASPLQYSYIRRDISMLLRFGACRVMARYPGTAPLGLSDLTQADGQTPGTDVGAPRHPAGTHMGSDVDVAYYHTGGVNTPTSICGDGSDRNANGTPGTYDDGNFCTTTTNVVDWPREIYWFGMLAQTPLVRVFGIDQTLITPFQTGLQSLEASGEITSDVLQRALILGYGAAGGWQYHFHHSHMSYSQPAP